jgi:hypothetical protein
MHNYIRYQKNKIRLNTNLEDLKQEEDTSLRFNKDNEPHGNFWGFSRQQLEPILNMINEDANNLRHLGLYKYTFPYSQSDKIRQSSPFMGIHHHSYPDEETSYHEIEIPPESEFNKRRPLVSLVLNNNLAASFNKFRPNMVAHIIVEQMKNFHEHDHNLFVHDAIEDNPHLFEHLPNEYSNQNPHLQGHFDRDKAKKEGIWDELKHYIRGKYHKLLHEQSQHPMSLEALLLDPRQTEEHSILADTIRDYARRINS